jgi:Rad3-related DNA helicase
MNHFQQVFFDEAHYAPTALAKAMSVVLHPHEINEILEIDFPPAEDREDFANWKEWASMAKEQALALHKEVETKVKGTANPKFSQVKLANHLWELIKRLNLIASARPLEWIVDETAEGFQFDPIRPAKYAEGVLLLRVPRIVMFSANIRPKTLSMLGLKKAFYEFREFRSDFDPRRSPIYWIRTMTVDYRNRHNISKLWLLHDQLASRRRDRNGIDHTISFQNQRELLANSAFSHSMIYNRQGEPSDLTIDQFRETYPGAILVGPSFGTGLDFPMQQAEWQFVCKLSFLDGRSKIMKARKELDKEYGPYHVAQVLTQQFGRATRKKEDQSEGFIGDDHMEWFVPRYERFFTKNFLERYRNRVAGRYTDILFPPQPPHRLEN